MKRIDNNEEALNNLRNIQSSLENKIRSIYNLGYREGYKDAIEDLLGKIFVPVDKLLLRDELKEEEAKRNNKK